MKWILNAYFDNEDYKQYTDDAVLYDKKDENVGSNIYDYMSYIVDNYDNLPDVILFGKTNMFERHITKEEFEKVKDNTTFTPLLTQNHRTYSDNEGVVCFYKDGLYYERNDFWYLREYPTRTNLSKNDLIKLLKLDTEYVGFAPGACYIVPKENILQHPKALYEKLKEYTGWFSHPGEAYLIERGLYNLWILPH
jgi:hypothetical protein